MYNLPAKTLVTRQLSKERLYKALPFKPGERRAVDRDVSRIDIVAQLLPETLPTLMHGERVKGITVLRLALKRECSAETLRLLARIPQTLLFALAYGEQVRFAVSFEQRIFISEPAAESEATLSLQGNSFDDLWLHLVAQVAGLKNGNEASLLAQIEKREQLQRLEAERASTEKKMWSTPQTHRRNELYAKLQQLNKQIKELSQEWRN